MAGSTTKWMEFSGGNVRDIDRTVFSQGPVVLFRWKFAGRWPVEYVTENVAEVFGYSASDFMNESVLYADIIHPDDFARVDREVDEHLQTGSDTFRHADYRIVRSDGGVRWVQDFTFFERDDSGRVIAGVGYIVDVTDRKLAEAELRKTQDELEGRVAERTAELTRQILEREQAETTLRRRDAIQQVINKTTMELFSAPDWTQIVDDVLKSVGEVAAADRVHVFENEIGPDERKIIRLSYEWTAPGIVPQMDNPQLHYLPDDDKKTRRWVHALETGHPIHALAREMPGAERDLAKSVDVLAVLMVPIFVDDDWWGTISFVASRSERTWSEMEIQALGLVAGALGTAIRRTQDEEALRGSEERLRGAIDSLQEGFAYFDAEDRLIVFNDAYRDLTPMADRAVAEAWRYEDLLRFNVERGGVVEARGNEEEFLQRRMEWHCDPGLPIILTYSAGQVVLIKEMRTPDGGTALTLIDITDLQEANQALEAAKTEAEQSKALLQDAIDSTTDAFSLYDQDGRLIVCNEAYKNLFRHTRDLLQPGVLFEDLLRQRAELGMVPDLEKDRETWLRKRMNHFFNPVGLMERQFPDGTWWQINEQRTRRGGIAQISTDITQIKAREEALQESEARFRNLFDNTAVGAMVIGLDGRYRAVNQALCNMLGYSEAELLGKTVLDVTHPLDLESGKQVIAKCGAGEVDSWVLEIRYRRKDGQTVWVIVSVAIVWDSGGNPAYAVGHVQDMTERKRAETATQVLRDELAHVSRVSTMGEMAAGFAHELNQPLTAIVNYAQGTLRRHRSGTAKREDFVRVLEMVVEQAYRAGDIIRGIRKFVRKEPSDADAVDINAAIEEAVDLVRNEAQQRDVLIELNLAEALPPTVGNAVQLQQVVLNLARNALEAMGHDGSNDRRLAIGTSCNENGDPQVTVEDSGPGIADEAKRRLFDPFFTTKAEGMGMGLSICKSIINAYGGGLSVDSAKCGGALFRVTLKAKPTKSSVRETREKALGD